MPWKLKEDKSISLHEDGKPIWVHSDGKEAPFDVEHTLSTIARLNGEAKTHREAKEQLEERFKAYDGLDDPEAARKAIETMKNLSAGDLKTAEQVEEIKREAKKAADEQVRGATDNLGRQIKGLSTERDTYRAKFHNQLIGASFGNSAYLKDKLGVPLDMVQSMFGGRFKVEDDKLVGYDAQGSKIYSRVRNGETADFDEAIEAMVDNYPHKSAIMKGSGSSGGFSGPRNNGGSGGGGREMSRAEFDRLSPMAQSQLMSSKERPAIVD